MKRADVIRLAGVTVELFDSFARRDLLPFEIPPGRTADRYELRHAVMLALALGLNEAGAGQFEASLFVRTDFDQLAAEVLRRSTDIYFGYAVSMAIEFDHRGREVKVAGKRPVICAAEDLQAAAESLRSRGELEALAMVLIRVDAIVALMLARARHWNLAISADDLLAAISIRELGDEG